MAINNAGLIAGTYGTEVAGRQVGRAVLWRAGRIVNDIPLPDAYDGIVAIDFNEMGHVTGTLTRFAAPGDAVQFEPYLYRDGVVTPLGQAFPGVNTGAYGMNDLGDVVGSAGGDAVLYSGGVYTNLSTLVPVPDGWFTAATDINNADQILIQAKPSAAHNEERTFMLTPVPEPTGAIVLLAAAPLLLARRRHCR